jgi:hypothetical protein
MLDADALRALAHARGTSESEAARDAIAKALAWSGMADALDKLRQLGAFAETERVESLFGPLPPARDDLVPARRKLPARRSTS